MYYDKPSHEILKWNDIDIDDTYLKTTSELETIQVSTTIVCTNCHTLSLANEDRWQQKYQQENLTHIQ